MSYSLHSRGTSHASTDTNTFVCLLMWLLLWERQSSPSLVTCQIFLIPFIYQSQRAGFLSSLFSFCAPLSPLNSLFSFLFLLASVLSQSSFLSSRCPRRSLLCRGSHRLCLFSRLSFLVSRLCLCSIFSLLSSLSVMPLLLSSLIFVSPRFCLLSHLSCFPSPPHACVHLRTS